MRQPALQAPGFRAAERPFGEGSLPAPRYAQKRSVDSRAGGRNATGPTGLVNNKSGTRETRHETSGVYCLSRTKVAPGVTPQLCIPSGRWAWATEAVSLIAAAADG